MDVGAFGMAFLIAGGLAAIGLVAGLVLGHPIRHWLGDKFAGFYVPNDRNFRVLPEYSVAEARLKQGRYREAVEEYRKVIEQFPRDVYAHVQIAQVALQQLHEPHMAETELKAALAKAANEDATMLVAHRLADLYLTTLHQPHQAETVLEQFIRRFPKSKSAKFTATRLRRVRAHA